jgi:hypothetical protein
MVNHGVCFVFNDEREKIMSTRHVALVSDVASITLSDVAQVAAALQKQAMRDLGPIWNVRASVVPVASLDRVPLGYWPIIVVADVQGAGGYHTDRNGHPYALVEAGDSWSVTASHECLEMLVDPWGRQTSAGPSVKPGQGRVEYLTEVCDPSENEAYAYTVNDVLVSDFYTPHFFDPVASPGVRYSFTGAIKAPRQVLPGGYLSWHDPVSDHWWQELYLGPSPVFKDLGVLPRDGRSIREIIDTLSPDVNNLSKLSQGNEVVKQAAARAAATHQATSARAAALRAHIAGVMAA